MSESALTYRIEDSVWREVVDDDELLPDKHEGGDGGVDRSPDLQPYALRLSVDLGRRDVVDVDEEPRHDPRGEGSLVVHPGLHRPVRQVGDPQRHVVAVEVLIALPLEYERPSCERTIIIIS